jgi:hypothetical protein
MSSLPCEEVNGDKKVVISEVHNQDDGKKLQTKAEKKKARQQRSFDMSKYYLRKISLKFYYLGWYNLLSFTFFSLCSFKGTLKGLPRKKTLQMQ